MSEYYFFTEADKISNQTQNQAFGAIDENSYRLDNMFAASSHPKAFAVTGGNILVQEVTGNENLVNIVLKPFNQLNLGLPIIDHIIYKGILKNSLVQTNVIASRTNNDLTRKIWDSFNLQVEELDITEPAPPDNPYADEVLGMRYTSSASRESQALDTDAVNIAFYNVTHTLFSVVAGDHIGDFSKDEFGIMIVFEKIGFQTSFNIARELDSILSFAPLSLEATNSQIFNRKHNKEIVCCFLDSTAFFSSFSQLGLNVYNGSDFDLLTTDDLYDSVTSKSYNKNKIYVDIRNEYDDSFNYYENYNNTIKVGLDNTSNLDNMNYYRSSWPILVLDNSEFDSNIIKIALPRGDNESPLVYYRKVFKEALGFNSPQGIEQFSVPAIENNLFPLENLITEQSDDDICANYFSIKIIRRINIENDGGCPLHGYSLFKRSYLDNLFPIFDMHIPFHGENYTNLKVYYDSHYIDKVLISQRTLNNNLSDYQLRDYVSSLGIATDQNHVSFIAFPFKYHSNFDNNNDFIPLSGMEMVTGNPFLIELNDRLSQVNLVRSSFVINEVEAEYLRFENNRLYGGATDIDEYSFDDVIIITITKQEFEQLELLKNQNFTAPYRVYLGVKNITVDVDDNGNRYTSFIFVLRGLIEDNDEIETKEVVTTLSSLTEADILGFHSGHIFPIENPYISSNYGPRALNGKTFHRGIDLVAQVPANTLGTDVVAVKSGTVTRLVKVEDNDPGGVRVRIRSQDNPAIEYNYFHLITNSNAHLALNQFVEQGTKIGEVGNTGTSSGAHLHFEIWNGTLNKISPYSIFPELALLPYTRHR